VFGREQAIAQIRLRRAMGLAAPRRRLPRQQQPDGVRLEYAKALLSFLSDVWAEVERSIFPVLPSLLEQNLARRDADLNDLIDQFSERFFRRLNIAGLEQLAQKFATQTSDFQRAQLRRQIVAAIGVDLPINEPGLANRIARFVSENVALIKSVPNTLFDDIEKRVTAAARAGTRWEDLAQELRTRLGIAEQSARRIARDQIGKFYAELNHSRLQALGAEAYFWRTLGDHRVRPEHQHREGKRFTWASPPSGGHPGSEVMCRCYAEPDFSSILEAAAP
jgi:SPP1 gp7 family putative phage head morphogenesis protein